MNLYNGNANIIGFVYGYFIDNLGAGGHYREFFQKGAYTYAFRVGDVTFGDNTGSLNYALRNARVDGRRIVLGQSTLNNVCR